MAIFYHGTPKLFDKFDLSHALEGDGKVKFGYGVYVTERYATAAHYAAGRDKVVDPNKHYYVYTIEVPEKKEDNYLRSIGDVHPDIIKRAEKKIGETIPAEVTCSGKLFRKWIGNRCIGMTGTAKKLSGSASLDAEKAATQFLLEIGVDFLEWPVAQTVPDGLQNRAILDDSAVRITNIEEVQLDDKMQLIEGSQNKVQ